MAGFLSMVLYKPFGMKGRRYLVKGKFKIISKKKVRCWEVFCSTTGRLMKTLTDSDDDVVSDNESESDE